MRLIVRQISGLGNQMFQYAAGLYYAQSYGAQLLMATDPPDRAFSYGYPRPFLLSHFAISAPYRELTGNERLLEIVALHPRIRSAMAILLGTVGVQFVKEELHQRFRFQCKLPIRPSARTVYLAGYWQVYQIADLVGEQLHREFSLRESAHGQNAELLRKIRNTTNSISLHIRRGDYTLAAEGNVALSMKYYAEAMRRIRQMVSDPTFFVFSDDMRFAHESLGHEKRAVFVEHNDSSAAHEDLRLMATCKHQIIANSTFSWWGAWLNSFEGKIVFAPRRWMVAQSSHYDDLFPPSWLVLD